MTEEVKPILDPSKAVKFDWPWLLGFHVNCHISDVTPEMQVAVIHPTSPECVLAGDTGVPRYFHILQPDGTVERLANPAWTTNSPPFTTAFLLFVDEAEARAIAPHLWIDAETD